MFLKGYILVELYSEILSMFSTMLDLTIFGIKMVYKCFANYANSAIFLYTTSSPKIMLDLFTFMNI